uniref:Uncharacterized protein n=1 Tax=Lepeophtheirus salmonis TaxID=72036 RepID=A0A0K2VJG0_LEPSM
MDTKHLWVEVKITNEVRIWTFTAVAGGQISLFNNGITHYICIYIYIYYKQTYITMLSIFGISP